MDGLIWLALVLAAGAAVWIGWKRSGLVWFDFVILRGARIYSRLWHRWSCVRHGPLPRTGPMIIVANHSCSADPNFILAAWGRMIGFMTAREHYNVHPFAAKILDQLGCVAVIRSCADISALRTSLRRLEQGRAIGIFPEGNLSGIARNRLRRPKAGMAFIALVTRAPVYPVYISGGPRTERLLNSWVIPSAKAVRVHFGKPLDLSAFYDRPRTRQVVEEAAAFIMEKVAELEPQTK